MALNNLKLDQLIGNETIPVFGARGQFLVTLETLSQIFASSGDKGDKGEKGDIGLQDGDLYRTPTGQLMVTFI